MRKWTTLSLAGSLTLTAVVACNDAPVAPRGPGAAPRASITAPVVPLGVMIQDAINTLLPADEAGHLTSKWNKVLDELAEAQLVIGDPVKYQSEIVRARQLLVDAIGYLQPRTSRIIPPPGETKGHAAARLALWMSLYVYQGPNTPPPDFPNGSDAVLAVVQPSATTATTVRTPTQHAAVQFPPGSLAETRIVVVSQLVTPFPENCSGPLDTRYCQYPQFYDFAVFPDVRTVTPAIVAVCHVNAGSARYPLADHARFEIAHDAPADPADRVAGGTIVDGIEILPFVTVSGLTSCAGNSYDFGAPPAPAPGTLGRALDRIGASTTRLASAIFEQLQPRAAWAIDGVGGGLVSLFSEFAVVDPQSVPDLDVGTVPTAVDISGDGGNALQIGPWAIRNVGTATAEGAMGEIIVAGDSLLTTNIMASSLLDDPTLLAPGESQSGGAFTLYLPSSFEGGTYFVGVRASLESESALGETNLRNNVRSRRIQLGVTP